MTADLSRNASHDRTRHAETQGSIGAARTAFAVTAAGISFLAIAAIWLGTCTGSTVDPLACGAPQRATLAVGAPAIVAAGAIYAGARSLRAKDTAWMLTATWLLILTILTAIPNLP